VGEVPGLERVAGKPEGIQEGLAALDGFGRSTGAMFFTGAAGEAPIDLDESTLPHDLAAASAPGAAVFFLDVDPASDRLGTRYPALAKHLPSIGVLSVIPLPGVVLPPGVRHAAVLTTGAKTKKGESLAASPELARIAELPAGQRASAAELLVRRGPRRAREERRGGGARSDVANLAVFTTSRRAEELPALRTRLRDLPEPELILDPVAAAPYTVAVFGVGTTPSLDDWLGTPDVDENGVEWPGGDNPGGIAHDAIGAVVSGAFVAPSLLEPETGHFERGPDGDFVIADPTAQHPGDARDPEGAAAGLRVSGRHQRTRPLEQPRQHARGRQRAGARGLRGHRHRRRAPRRAGRDRRREEQLQRSPRRPGRHPGRIPPRGLLLRRVRRLRGGARQLPADGARPDQPRAPDPEHQARPLPARRGGRRRDSRARRRHASRGAAAPSAGSWAR
jgi:hypothetical protein